MHFPRFVVGALIGSLVVASAAAESTDSAFTDAFTGGKFSLNARLRWEHADQDNLRASDALTLRTRLGFTTKPQAGLQAMIEAENIASLGDEDRYNAAGTHPGGLGRTVIADPPTTALNQAWLSYRGESATVKAGRQRIVLDNARFIGDVGWRQNMQTFDAATLTFTPTPTVTAQYGYLWRVNRVFGNKAPQRDWKGDSHLFNVAYRGLKYGTLTGYTYLLDFDNAAANSTATYGASFAGSAPATEKVKVTYRLEAARQRDRANNPVNYEAEYYAAELGAAVAPFDFGVGHEVLGSDGGRRGFVTPLATLHAFNGWADVFLATPANGLRDTYVSAGMTLPRAVPVKVVWHDYRSDAGSRDYGSEWNVIASRKFGANWTALAKYADFDGKGPFADVKRFWLQAEFNF